MRSFSKPIAVFFTLLIASGFFVFAKRPGRFLASNPSLQGGYCLAIRGNGDAMPAHWGGMAHALESFGVPSGVAGGSSGSISAFLLESVIMNPLVSEADRVEKLAFLIKSFEGFTYYMAEKPEWKAVRDLVNTIDNSRAQKEPLVELQKILAGQSVEKVLGQGSKLGAALREIQTTGIFGGVAIQKLLVAYQKYSVEKTENRKVELLIHLQQVKKSFEVLGAFDAKNDRDLFLRDGVIDFSALAKLFGRMGDFYSLSGAPRDLQKLFEVWLNACSANSKGRTWSEIAEKNPGCAKNFGMLIDSYFQKTKGEEYRIHDTVGQHLPALISTSVVVGESAKSVGRLKIEFDGNYGQGFDGEMSIANDDLKFGYWGSQRDLNAAMSVIQSVRFPAAKIDKSKRFLALGEEEWSKPLSLSPAEPGLSPFLPFRSGRDTLLSFGGWSDLHPIPALKAMGCGKVVYLTRMGGDTLFGQGVAKRLFRLDDIRWEDLDGSNPAAVKRNHNGVRENQNGRWSQMYNLANPRSSYSFSLSMADAVICTNWNDFDLKKEFRRLIQDSYSAPIFVRGAPVGVASKEFSVIQKSDNSFDSALGYPRYAGCIYP
jgi:hypothetical protein